MALRKAWKAGYFIRKGIEIRDAFIGKKSTRLRYHETMSAHRDFRSQQVFTARGGDLQRLSTEEPIFILSAGWRSGSTMLQRMLMGQEKVLIWGEPYDHSDILGSLKQQWLAFSEDWPAEGFFFQGDTEGMARQWVANLYPDLQDLYDAHVSLLTRLFAEPARRVGCTRWGVKEVRWTVDDAHFLKWIFPRAKFLFLCRNPLHAWRSYRDSRCWYFRWPEDPVLTPYRYGRLWTMLAKDFQANHAEVDGLFLHYEDLITTKDFRVLESYLGLKISTPQEIGRIRSKKRGKELVEVPAIERWLLGLGCKEAMGQLGYPG